MALSPPSALLPFHFVISACLLYMCLSVRQPVSQPVSLSSVKPAAIACSTIPLWQLPVRLSLLSRRAFSRSPPFPPPHHQPPTTLAVTQALGWAEHPNCSCSHIITDAPIIPSRLPHFLSFLPPIFFPLSLHLGQGQGRPLDLLGRHCIPSGCVCGDDCSS